MPRKPREKSATGIYHVMLRGINKENIFFSSDDFELMQRTIFEAQRHKEITGETVYGDCTVYAYCIMNNHVHILLKEGTKSVSDIMRKIEDRYAVIYNKKYDRVGHLFQDRFRSEPVGDIAYFHVLMRYIHRNPVKGMECATPEEYPHSSWREYLPDAKATVVVILPEALNFIDVHFERMDLVEWVNMDVDDKCMDIDTENYVISDNAAWKILSDIAKEKNPEDFKKYPKDVQLECLLMAIRQGISKGQAIRLSSLTRYTIDQAVNSLNAMWSHDGMSIDYKTKIEAIKEEKHTNRLRMLQIVSMCGERRVVKTKDISNSLVISDSLARRLISRMVAHQILKKEGGSRSTFYSLI